MGKITQAVISAGGFGARLRPFTDTAPKPMMPILGKPLLEWHVEQFKKYGVNDFLFTLHYLPEVVRSHFKDGARWGVHIDYAIEPEPLGSAGGLKLLEGKLQERFFYIYGDTFSLMDYGKMETAYAEKVDPIGMQRMKKTDDYADADVAELDEHGRFVAIHAKPHARHYPNAYRMRGAFMLEESILGFIPEGQSDLAKKVLPAAVAAGKNFYAYECDDYSKGIDTMEKLLEVEHYLQAQPQVSP